MGLIHRVRFLPWSLLSSVAFAEGVNPPAPTLLCAPYQRIVISGWGVDLQNIGGTPLTQAGSWAQYALGPSGGAFNGDPAQLSAFYPWFLQSWDGVLRAVGSHCPDGTRFVSLPVNDYEGLIMTQTIVAELQNGWNMGTIGLLSLCVLIGFFMGYKMMQRAGSQ